MVEMAVAVLKHGILHTLARNEEYGTLTDVHAMIGDAFEIMYGKGGPDALLGGASFLLVSRVHREVHSFRVEKIYPRMFLRRTIGHGHALIVARLRTPH